MQAVVENIIRRIRTHGSIDAEHSRHTRRGHFARITDRLRRPHQEGFALGPDPRGETRRNSNDGLRRIRVVSIRYNRHSLRVGSIERSVSDEAIEPSRCDPAAIRERPIRMLRLAQVIDMTGLGKTKIYELQAGGSFPMRVKITAHSVGWIEDEVQAWLARRVQATMREALRT